MGEKVKVRSDGKVIAITDKAQAVRLHKPWIVRFIKSLEGISRKGKSL